MMKQPITEELHLTADDLLVFIDDTGHETFAGNQAYYGLGGCIVLGAHYGLLKAEWMDVRRQINGSPDTPLHASQFPHSQTNFDVLSKFFLNPSFLRIAAASIRSTPLPTGMHPAMPVMGILHEYVIFAANNLPCSRVTMIVESSQRADPVIRQHFLQLQPDRAEIKVPVTYCLMPKSGAEPGLEIADFIINAAGSQVRRYMRGEAGLALDFNDVFGRLPPTGCLFSVVGDVAIDPESGLVRVEGVRLSGNPSSIASDV
jgi:hypothetical protein